MLPQRAALGKLDRADGRKYGIDQLQKQGVFAAQRSWVRSNGNDDSVALYRYEESALDNAGFLKDLLDYLGVPIPESEFLDLCRRHAFAHYSGGREQSVEDLSSHYRKGIAGDWKIYFDESVTAYFEAATGDLLHVLGYTQ
jgi:hypothetical protein